MKIVVTGSSGYIARNLAKSFNNKNKIILLNRKKNLKSLNFDLKKKIIPKLSCDILIHAAAITPQKSYSQKDFNNINFLSLKEIIKKIEIKKKIIFFSTTDVYKNQNTLKPVKENFKINFKKISDYAKSKYKCEIFLKSLKKQEHPFQKIILRLPGIVGKGNHQNFITSLIDNIIFKKGLVKFNKDSFFNNIYHIDALVKLIKMLINKAFKKNFLIINVGAKNPIKISKIMKIIQRASDQKKTQSSKVKSFTINVTKLNKYYKRNQDTKIIIKKYLKEKLQNKK